MSVLISSLFLLAAAAQDDAAKPKTLSTDFVTKASTEQLAKAVLPPEIAAKVIGHKLSPPYLHWIEGYRARFGKKRRSSSRAFASVRLTSCPCPNSQRAR